MMSESCVYLNSSMKSYPGVTAPNLTPYITGKPVGEFLTILCENTNPEHTGKELSQFMCMSLGDETLRNLYFL